MTGDSHAGINPRLSARSVPRGGARLPRAYRAVLLGLLGRLARGLLARDRQQHLPLAFDPLAPFFWLRRSLFRPRRSRRLALALHAAPQGVHEIDYVCRLTLLGVLDLGSGLLALQQFLQCVLVLV